MREKRMKYSAGILPAVLKMFKYYDSKVACCFLCHILKILTGNGSNWRFRRKNLVNYEYANDC